MNKESILLLTKDAQCKVYYPCYGNKYYKDKTPNLDELVAKGTIFNRFYTAAPSSNMSYLSMFTMKYPYQHNILRYEYLDKDYEGETFFDKTKVLGFENHIIWDSSWDQDIQYTKCYGDSIIHSIEDLKQAVGAHFLHKERLCPDDKKALNTLNNVRKEVENIMSQNKKVFLWIHLPHVLNGRTAYGSDMDLYDQYIGMLREYFDDSNIFISADHGNMNGSKGKIGYGFHVYESSICIPLITPRINNKIECNDNLCNIDFFDIIFNRHLPSHKFIYSDSSYYGQPNRKLCIVFKNFRYIYNKYSKKEELYDIDWDPNQDFNLIADNVYDTDRYVTTPACEYYFYPYWDDLSEIRSMLRKEKKRIWREADFLTEFYNKINQRIKPIHAKIKRLLK